MKFIPRLILLGFTAWATVAHAEEFQTMEDAYRFLLAHGISTHDERSSQAIRRLQQDPAAAKQFLVERFLAERPDESKFGAPLIGLPREVGMEVVRKIVAHYPYGDTSTPFVGAIIHSGTRADMETLAGLFDVHRDEPKAVGLAVMIISLDNPHAHEALVSFRERFPGRWLEYPEVKKFFANRAATEAVPAKAAVAAPAPSAAPEPKPPVESKSVETSPREPRPAALPPEVSNRGAARWWVFSGIAVILGGLLYWVRRKRESRRATGSDGPGEASS